jgi:hypothetical protein
VKPLAKTWTPEQLALLGQLVKAGASAARASVALNRSLVNVRAKASSIGMPFTPVRQARAERLLREERELRRLGS